MHKKMISGTHFSHIKHSPTEESTNFIYII